MRRMSRRRREADGVELVFKLVVLVVFLSLLSPAVRQALLAFGFVALIFFCLVVAASLAYLIYRKIRKPGATSLTVFNQNTQNETS